MDLPVLPALSVPSNDAAASGSAFVAATGAEAARWEAAIAELELEARANPALAPGLLLEVGRIWEEHLAVPRNAALAYQRAFNADPRDLAVLHASRRLFTDAEKWTMVVEILGHEIAAAETLERKASLLAEKGIIFEQKLHDADEAERAFREALDAWSAEPLAVDALERLHLSRHRYDELYRIYLGALDAAPKPERRLPLLVAAAQLAEDRLDDPEAAMGHYREVLAIDAANPHALAALRRLTLQSARWSELVEVLEKSAANSAEAREAADYLLDAARVLGEKLRLTDKSLLMMLRALERAPEELSILRPIELLYQQHGRHDEVVKVLRREAEITVEPRDRVPILFRLGTTLDEQLHRHDDAIEVFREAVTLMPDYVPARQALGRLLGKLERWRELGELFEMEIQVEEDREARVSKLLKLAELADRKLADANEAVRHLRRILEIDRDYQPARKYLERLFHQQANWNALLELYESELGLTEDRDQRIFLLDRIGVLAEDELHDLDRASKAYERILELTPGHLRAIRTLSRIAEKREAWADVLRMHELEIEATEDQKEVVALLFRAGAISEEKLGNVEAAVERYAKVLALSPTYLPALSSLGRIYLEQRRWDDLLLMFARELDVTKSTEKKIGLLFRSAGVLLERVGDDRRAADVYNEILALRPDSLPAIRALEDIYARTRDWERLVDILVREGQILTDPKEKASTLLRVGLVCEEHLDRADRAAEAYQEILRLGCHFDAAIHALVRIYSSEGMWNALGKSLKTAYEHAKDASARSAILIRLAEVAGDRLGNLDAAAGHLEEALEHDPANATVLLQLERISVARRDWKRVVEVSEMLAANELDPRLYAARQIRIARIKESELEPPEPSAVHYRLALDRMPDHPVALRALELAYLRAHDFKGLASFYWREALVTRDPSRRRNLYCRAADVAEYRLFDRETAARMYAAALEADAAYLPALRGRRRVAEKSKDASTLLDCIRAETAIVTDATRRRELAFEAACIEQDALGNVDRALETYQTIVADDPVHLGAFNRLEAILLEREAWQSLAELLEQRAAAVTDPTERARLLVSSARVVGDRIGDRRRAAALYSRVLDADPHHAAALAGLGPILMEERDWDRALDIFMRTLAVDKTPAVQLRTFKALGTIYRDHRPDPVRCVQSHQAALHIDPNDRESLESLASLYRSVGDAASSINVLLRLAEVQPNGLEKVKTLLALSEVYDTGASDRKNAIAAARMALDLEPSSEAAIVRLMSLYESAADWSSLVDVSSTYLRLLPASETARAVPVHLKMADIFANKLGDEARAMRSLDQALLVDPRDEGALETLVKLHARKPQGFARAIDIHRRLLELDPFRVASYREMHRMFLSRKEHDRAFVVAEILVFLRAAEEDEDLYYQEHKAKVAPHASAKLSGVEHERWVTHPDERGPLRTIFEQLALELPRALEADLSRYDLNRKTDRHGPGSNLPLRKLADELAAVLEIEPTRFDIWITQRFELDLVIENGNPPALIVGSSVGRRVQEKDQRYLVGRLLERLKGGHLILDRLDANDAELLVWSLVRAANASAVVPVDPAALESWQKRLAKAVSGRVRRTLDDAAKLVTLVDLAKHRRACVHTANRAGLVLGNDIEVAVRNIARSHPNVRAVFKDAAGARDTIGRIDDVRELLRYAVSEEYFAARARLGFSIQA